MDEINYSIINDEQTNKSNLDLNNDSKNKILQNSVKSCETNSEDEVLGKINLKIEEINDLILIDDEGKVFFFHSSQMTLDSQYLESIQKEFEYILNKSILDSFIKF
jgi:hypothetical protein